MADPIVAKTPLELLDANKVNNVQNVNNNPGGVVNVPSQSPTIGNTKPSDVSTASTDLGNQNSTNVATSGAGKGTVISTSAPAVAEEKNTTSDLEKLMTNDNTDLTNNHQSYIDMLQKEYDRLEAQRASQVETINKGFDQKSRQLEQNQKGENGTFTATLARIGGYLGDSASSTAAMVNLNQEHTYQINDLESRRQDAILTAKNAIDDKQFKLAQAKVQEAKDYATEIQKNKQDFFNNSVKLLEIDKKANDAKEKAKKDNLIATTYASGTTDVGGILKALNAAGHTDITTEDIAGTLKNIIPAGLDDIVKTVRTNGAPPEVIKAVLDSTDLNEAYQKAGSYASGGTGIVGEYNFYVAQARSQGQVPVDFNTYQNMDANRKAKVAAAANGSGLSNSSLIRVQSIANQFDSEQIVKDYNNIVQNIDAVRSAGDTPTDDIQRIYAFAKIMDPNSVVREGEYKTVQDYSQALLQKYGIQAQRIYDNKGFLTKEARTFLENTLENRLKSTDKAYKNLYDEYGRRINMITGDKNGQEFISDYSKPFNTADDILKTEAESKDFLINYGKTNPNERQGIMDLVTNNDPTLKRPMTYSEAEQYLKATGKIK